MTIVALTFLLSVLLCGGYLRIARKADIVDKPNARSSHTRETPHAGGLPLFLAFFAGLAAVLITTPWPTVYALVAGMAAVLVLLGVLDDVFSLSVKLRFLLYAVLAVMASTIIVGLPATLGPVQTGLLIVLGSMAILWMLNLYNFMDGIDGIAAIQAVLTCACAALLSYGADARYALFCTLLGAAYLGFLIWNWPPARLFMGDAGSVPAGFLFACLALLGAVEGALNPACWLILLALFITDATWTLLWRVGTGQPFTQGHRLHAYQRLSRHWQSHLKVDAALIVVLLVWLGPLAWAAQKWPENSIVLVILAYLPWVIAMAKVSRLT